MIHDFASSWATPSVIYESHRRGTRSQNTYSYALVAWWNDRSWLRRWYRLLIKTIIWILQKKTLLKISCCNNIEWLCSSPAATVWWKWLRAMVKLLISHSHNFLFIFIFFFFSTAYIHVFLLLPVPLNCIVLTRKHDSSTRSSIYNICCRIIYIFLTSIAFLICYKDTWEVFAIMSTFRTISIHGITKLICM